MNTKGKYIVILLGTLIGILSLAFFSLLQKTFMGIPLSLSGFIVPISYGGIVGLLISLFILRSRRLNFEMARKEQEYRNRVLMTQIQAEESERNRLGRELHDGLGPIISSAKMYFQMLSKTCDEEKKKIIIGNGNESLNEALSSLREISYNLNPYVLTHCGIEVAISKFIERIEVNDDIRCSCSIRPPEKLSSELELTIYRIVTELINNSVRHGNATAIDIYFADEGDGKLILRYTDNGKGFDMKKQAAEFQGLGLFNIRNRIRAMEGSSSIKTSPDEGFRFTCVLPAMKGENHE